MLFTNFAQFVVLVLVLIMGFAFGLASNNGRKKWRLRYDKLVESSNAYRAEIAGQLREAETRAATAERDNADLRARLDQNAAQPAADAIPATAETPRQKKGWFAWGSENGDDLTRIRGLDADLATRLRGLGVTRYADIVDLSDEDEIALEQRLTIPAGYITREQWRDQAALLAAGQTAKHKKRFGVS